MPDIKDSVGHNAINRKSDVAMVQAMLRVLKDANKRSYFNADYDGNYNAALKFAILNFQNAHKLVPAEAKGPVVLAKGAAPDVKNKEQLGRLIPNGPTLAKMNTLLSAAHKDHKEMRIIDGTRTVYAPADAKAAAASEDAITAEEDLEPGFRKNVAKLVHLMYERHKIVLSVTTSGWRRTFQAQYDLTQQKDPKTGKAPTQAGPGESNHNFGRAVDIGLKGFKWLKGDGSWVTNETWWLHKLVAAGGGKSDEMWAARNKIAVDELGLHASALKGDLIHLQSFSDAKVSMRRSLADLLSRVGQKMKWAAQAGGYATDFGLGGKKMYPVGKATDLWAEKAQVTKAVVAEIWTTSKKKAYKVTDVKDADVTNLKNQLKGELQSAELEWTQWQPK
jgi:LAS superfamily LD-carboxypeptidase LdcB